MRRAVLLLLLLLASCTQFERSRVDLDRGCGVHVCRES